MKKYYTGDIEGLIIQKLTIGDEAPRIVQSRYTIQRDVLFYKNIMGVFIRFEDRCPLPTYEEATGYMDQYISESYPSGTYYSFPFYDESRLTKIEMTIAKEKTLLKERKVQRKRAKN